MPTIDVIAGARPNLMKVASILRALDARRAQGGALGYRLVHTGQHYDPRMSGDFFAQLGIPEPAVNLEVGSGSHAEQTGAIMLRYEALLAREAPALCLVVGDVTSTLACAITARKAGLRVAHVEAGLRSGDWTMPEEINRRVTDALSDWLFTTSEGAGANLRAEGAPEGSIHFVGNTMIDTLLAHRARFRRPEFAAALGLAPGGYFVLTLHRPALVDDPARLEPMLHAVADGARGLPVVYPVHPRTARVMAGLGALPANLHCVEPQPYLEFNGLVADAKAVITDSGGITEETTVLGVPCLTLRDTTERPETVELGTNALIGTAPAALAPAFSRLFEGRWPKGRIPPLWDGRAGERIVAVLERALAL